MARLLVDKPPEHADVVLPQRRLSPLASVLLRLGLAVLLLVAVSLIVYSDRSGYQDNADGEVSLLDAFYYSTVSLSTTGYGDITPVSDHARLINILVITPLRIAFLILLVGTTLAVLTERSRRDIRIGRWRSHVHDHTVIVGFGTKGRSALSELLSAGRPPGQIVVIDSSPQAVAEATRLGVAGLAGDATRSDVLLRARGDTAREFVVAPSTDDTAVLVTLTAKKVNPRARVIAAVRESENLDLLEQSGADTVITSAAAAGRLLALSVTSPTAGKLMEDLLVTGDGIEVVEREITRRELGHAPLESPDIVLAVIRDGIVSQRLDPDFGVRVFQSGDRLVVIRRARAANGESL